MARNNHYFVAIYIGRSIASARIAAASTDPPLVQLVAKHILEEIERHPDTDTSIQAIDQGRIAALRTLLVDKEAARASQ